MKKFLVFLCAMFVCVATFAHTINWHVGDQIISTTTCSSGDTVTPPTVPAKYGYHVKNWRKPYIELEYIESTGTQYIDTGITGDCELSMTAQGIESANNIAEIVVGSSPINSVSWFGKQTGLKAWDTSSISYTNKVDIFIQFKDAPAGRTVNGQSCTATNGTISDSLRIRLFGLDPYMAKVRIFRATFTRDGRTIRNLIPAKTPNGLVGMFDTVSYTFFTNQGTGEFIAGPEVGAF